MVNAEGKPYALEEDIPTVPGDIGAKKVQSAVNNKIEKSAHVLSSLSQNTNGDISYEVKELTPGDIGAAPAPGEKNVYLELVNTGNTGVVTEAASGFDTVNFSGVALQVDGNDVLTTASTISTDKLVGGSEIWIIDCGTSTTVI